MKIFAILEDVGSEYETLVSAKISLNPFEDDCYYVDLEPTGQYNTVIHEGDDGLACWKPYNVEFALGEYFCNPNTGEYIDSKIVNWSYDELELENGEIINIEDPKYEDWEYEWILFQKYENGLPVGKPYFKFD